MNPQQFLTPNMLAFGGLATLAALASVGVVAMNNAVRSALMLVLNFVMLAFLYFTLGAETIGITQVIVYTGAIMVLVLFVIMLLNLGAIQFKPEKLDYRLPLGILGGLVTFGAIAASVLLPLVNIKQTVAPEGFGAPQSLGTSLFLGYTWPFELVSILLVVGIVGSIFLAKRKL